MHTHLVGTQVFSPGRGRSASGKLGDTRTGLIRSKGWGWILGSVAKGSSIIRSPLSPHGSSWTTEPMGWGWGRGDRGPGRGSGRGELVGSLRVRVAKSVQVEMGGCALRGRGSFRLSELAWLGT